MTIRTFIISLLLGWGIGLLIVWALGLFSAEGVLFGMLGSSLLHALYFKG